MSGAAAPQAGNVIDLSSSPDDQAWKRQRNDGAGSTRNARRNGAQRNGQVQPTGDVIDMTQPQPAGVPRRHAAGVHQQPYANVEVAVQRRDGARGSRRGQVAAATPLHQPPGAALPLAGRVRPVAPVAFEHVLAVPAQPLPAQAMAPGKRKRASATAPTQEEEEEKNVPTCAICLDSLKDHLCCAPCGHVFHHKCLKEAIVKFKYCPTCRKPIKKESQIKKIFM